MKILLFTQMYPNNQQQNLGIFVEKRAQAILKYAEVIVVSPQPLFNSLFKVTKIPYQQERNNIRIFYPKYFPLPGRIFYPIKGLWFLLFTYFLVKKIKKDFEFDLLHAHKIFPEGFAAALFKKIWRKPVIITIHGSDIYNLNKNLLLRKKSLYALKSANHIITVSNLLRDILLCFNIKCDKISVFKNAVDINIFKPLDKKEIRKRLQLSERKKIILFVGNLVQVKNPLFILDFIIAKRDLFRKHNLLVVFLGEGLLKTEMMERVEKHNLNEYTRILGRKPHSEISQWMNAADMLILTSYSEGLPTVILEAMSTGLPVIAAKVGGVPEIVMDGKTGFLYDVDNQRQFEFYLNKLLENDSLRNHMSKASILYIKNNKLSWDNHAQKLFKTYKQIVRCYE